MYERAISRIFLLLVLTPEEVSPSMAAVLVELDEDEGVISGAFPGLKVLLTAVFTTSVNTEGFWVILKSKQHH